MSFAVANVAQRHKVFRRVKFSPLAISDVVNFGGRTTAVNTSMRIPKHHRISDRNKRRVPEILRICEIAHDGSIFGKDIPGRSIPRFALR